MLNGELKLLFFLDNNNFKIMTRGNKTPLTSGGLTLKIKYFNSQKISIKGRIISANKIPLFVSIKIYKQTIIINRFIIIAINMPLILTFYISLSPIKSRIIM